MKLFLSSFGVGNRPDELVALVGTGRLALVVNNGLDAHGTETRSQLAIEQIATLRGLGFEPEELDLRHYFTRQPALPPVLERAALVWVRGGNAFVLRRAMRQSRFDEAIRDLLDRDAIVYGGYSAGTVVVTSTLRGIELVDDPTVVPAGYEPEVLWDGLGLVGFSIAPHFESDHPESEAIDDVVRYFEQHQMSYRTLRDGQALLVRGSQVTTLG